jgi:hypothetical protein
VSVVFEEDRAYSVAAFHRDFCDLPVTEARQRVLAVMDQAGRHAVLSEDAAEARAERQTWKTFAFRVFDEDRNDGWGVGYVWEHDDAAQAIADLWKTSGLAPAADAEVEAFAKDHLGGETHLLDECGLREAVKGRGAEVLSKLIEAARAGLFDRPTSLAVYEKTMPGPMQISAKDLFVLSRSGILCPRCEGITWSNTGFAFARGVRQLGK